MDHDTVSSILVFSIAVLASVFLSYAVVRYGGSRWGILRRWDVPWSWQTMIGASLAIEFLPLLIVRHLRLETNVQITLARLLIDSGAAFIIIGILIIFYKPLPPDLFYWGVSNRFGLGEGWLLWAIIGFIGARATFTATMWIIDYLSFIMDMAYHSFIMRHHMTQRGAQRPRRRRAMRKTNKRNRNDSERHVHHVNEVVDSSIFRQLDLGLACLKAGSFTLAPLVEESTYRGFLMASLSKWLPTPIAVLMSSVVFAVVHRSLGQLPHLFISGLILGLIYAQTRNLLTPITMHAMWNFGVAFGILMRGRGRTS